MNDSFAGFRERIAAFALDYVIIAAYLILVVAAGVGMNTAFPAASGQIFGSPVSGQVIGFLMVTLPVTLYFALSESSTRQATWGKQKRHLRVIRTDGGRLSFPRALGRTLLKFVPWELAHTCIWQAAFASPEPSPLITAGFVLVYVLVGANIASLFATRTRQTLYDRLAGTVVVTGAV